MITHKEYMDSTQPRIHGRYYAQFVTQDTRNYVLRYFTRETLIKAYRKDPHFNSIPLKEWDAIAFTNPRNDSGPFRALVPFDRDAHTAAGDYVTRSVLICITKEAARQIATEKASDRG